MTLKRLEYDHVYNLNVTMIYLLVAVTLLTGGYFAVNHTLRPVIHALETTVITLPDKRTSAARKAGLTIKTTWRKRLSSRGTMLYLQCRIDPVCNKGLRVKRVPYLGITLILLGLASGTAGFMINALLRRKRDQLDNAKWLAMNVYKHRELPKFTEGVRGEGGDLTDPVIVKVGYVIEQLPMPTNVNPNRPLMYKYLDLKPIGLTSKMLQEHVLVYGPTGTGKTSRVLMHFLLAFAKRGDAVVLPDFKFPQVREGFLEALVLFRRMGRPVYPVLPYSVGGVHIPLLDTLQTPQQAKAMAAIFMPSQEYGSSNADFYVFTQQIILGSVMRTVGGSATPTLAEVIRVMRLSLPEFGLWLQQSGDTEAISELARFLRLKDADWNQFITGILNALDPFSDDRVNRTFTSVPGKNFDPETFITQGGMLYIGIPTDKMRGKAGPAVMRVIDTYVTNELVRLRAMKSQTGPQVSIRMVYDEAPNIKRLQNLLASVSALRSLDFSFIFGLQNESQMEIEYTEALWKAITATVGTQIILPTGFKDDAAATLSRYLGDREVKIRVDNQSQGTGGLAESAISGKRGHSVVTQKRPLVTPSEIEEWPYFLGIFRTKGTLPPALLAMVPTHDPKPTFYGLDGRPFFVNNRDVYDEFTNIMDVMSEAERTEEVTRYINETVTPDDLNEHLPTTLTDLFNEWVRYAILDGTLFRRNGKTFQFRYDTVDISLRDGTAERVVRAFVRSGWFDPGDSVALTPADWDWVTVTEAGIGNLSPFVQAELKNVRYLTEYIHARKQLHLAASNLSGGILEARELLPVTAARQATLQLLTRTEPNATPKVLEAATELMMARFTRATVDSIEMVAIPLNFPFEHVVKRVLLEAERGGHLSAEDVTPRTDGRANLNRAIEHLERAERPDVETEPVAAAGAVETAQAPSVVPVTQLVVMETPDILPDEPEDLPFPVDLTAAIEQYTRQSGAAEHAASSKDHKDDQSIHQEVDLSKNHYVDISTSIEIDPPGPQAQPQPSPPPRRQRRPDLLTQNLQGHDTPAPSVPEPAHAHPDPSPPAPAPTDSDPADTDHVPFAPDW